MSLKQFPSHGKFSLESDLRHEIKDPVAFRDIPPRLKADVFDVNKSWRMMREKKKVVDSENVAVAGFKNMTRTDAARIAAAAGLSITKDFSSMYCVCVCVCVCVHVCVFTGENKYKQVRANIHVRKHAHLHTDI